MSRCTACNKTFTESEMVARNPITKEFEDMCSDCRAKSRGFNLFSEDKTHVVCDLKQVAAINLAEWD